MTAENEVVDGNNLHISAVIMGAAFDNVHASLRIGMA